MCPPSRPLPKRSTRAPALWRGGEVQLNRLAAGARARLDGDLSGTGLEDQRRGLLGAVDADPGAEHPAARAVATRLMRCQSEAVAHHASTLAAARHAVNHVPSRETARSSDAVWWLAILFGLLSAAINLPIVEKPVQRLAAAPA
jgi:hypothetical protein